MLLYVRNKSRFLATVVLRIQLPNNRKRIWDKKVNKCRFRIKPTAPMQRLFEEFSITKKTLQSKSNTALEIYFHQKRCSS